MGSLRMGALAFGVVGVLLTAGCQQNKGELDTLRQQNQALQAQLADRDTRLRDTVDPAQVQQMQADLAQRDAKIHELEAQLRQPVPGAPPNPGIAGIETTYDAKAGTMTVNLPGDVLFDSGSATIKDSAKTTLSKIAAALKRDYAGKRLRVEGHTDRDPIVRTKEQWEDNLDLSLARAAAVTRYLQKCGVKPALVTTSGLGDTRPKATKPKSRRVEIVVVVG